MKFGKYLAENSVPEWRSRYVNYRILKKLIKNVVAEKQRSSSLLQQDSDESMQGFPSLSTDDLTPDRSTPGAVEGEITAGPSSSSRVRNATVDTHHVGEDPQFLLSLEETQLGPEERAFFLRLDQEVRKADVFYQLKETDARTRLLDLKRQCEILELRNAEGNEQKRGFLQFGQEQPEKFIVEDEDEESIGEDGQVGQFTPVSKNPRNRLQKAFLEYYRLLELLKNFRIINHTSLTKILKKMEKNTGTHGEWYMARAKGMHLFTSTEVEDLIAQTEALFIDVFAKGNRHKAMRSLRLPDLKAQGSSGATNWKTGFLMGLSLPAIVLTLRKVFAQGFPDKNVALVLLVYGGLSIPIVFLFLYALLLVIWARFHVNWVLVFELDPRDYLTPEGFAEFASVLFFLFSYTLYLALDDNFLSFISLKWYPTILLGMIIGVIIIPFDVFYRSSRKWFLTTMARIVLSGFFTVQFRDFFITDLLSSMTYMFVSLQILVCVAVNDLEDLDAHCGFSTSWVVPVITSIPAWFRLLQCLRRYYDTPTVHPHLTNALKYCFSLSVIWLSASAKITGFASVRGLWIFFAVVASMYSYFWDVWFDWGLFQRNSKHKYLRKVIVYPKWVYVSAIGINFVLRLSWVFLLSPNNWGLFQDARLLVYLQALAELFRRFMWSILRMENEHTNNIGKFRAVTEVPLPFRVKIIPEPNVIHLKNVRGRTSMTKSASRRELVETGSDEPDKIE
ncbi:Xenotropic and polytropic retrovirus receptor 1 [Thoreauomyces humboldtii]|nr:Xenotropic and polytropic retrovirus receptor 1 [Thoreauomyces humboldtii]